MDSIQLECALSKHGSGIYLLAAPKRIEDSELVADSTIGDVIEMMRQLFDLRDRRLRRLISMRPRSPHGSAREHLFYVLDQSIGAARCAWRFVDLCGRLGLQRSRAGIHHQPLHPNHPISEEQMSHTLARPIYAKIPRDEKVLERVQLQRAGPLAGSDQSPLAKSVEEMARRLDGGRRSGRRTQRFDHVAPVQFVWRTGMRRRTMKLVERIQNNPEQRAGAGLPTRAGRQQGQGPQAIRRPTASSNSSSRCITACSKRSMSRAWKASKRTSPRRRSPARSPRFSMKRGAC